MTTAAGLLVFWLNCQFVPGRHGATRGGIAIRVDNEPIASARCFRCPHTCSPIISSAIVQLNGFLDAVGLLFAMREIVVLLKSILLNILVEFLYVL